MIFEDIKDEDLEQTLLKYIDMPYFKNNPFYIALWERYYRKTGDARTLFLMRYKKISQYYHWIYIEMSRFFMSKNHPGMCPVVLNMGIACGAYDSKVLEDELKAVSAADRVYFEHEINFLMNPKGFLALGKTWNSYEEALFYDRKIFKTGDEELSFEEYRSILHKNGKVVSKYDCESITTDLKKNLDTDEVSKKFSEDTDHLKVYESKEYKSEGNSESSKEDHSCKKLRLDETKSGNIETQKPNEKPEDVAETVKEPQEFVSDVEDIGTEYIKCLDEEEVADIDTNFGLDGQFNSLCKENFSNESNNAKSSDLNLSNVPMSDFNTKVANTCEFPENLEYAEEAVSLSCSREDGKVLDTRNHNLQEDSGTDLNLNVVSSFANSSPEIPDILVSGLDINSELIIDGYIFYVKEIVSRRKYKLMRIAKEGREAQTINVKDFLLHEASEIMVNRVSGLSLCYIPLFTVVKALESKLFLLCEYYQLGSLERCLSISDNIDPGIVLYFADQLIEIFNSMDAESYTFASFSLDSICVTEDCKLKIVDFDWIHSDSSIDYYETVLTSLSKYANICPGVGNTHNIALRIKNELKKINLKQIILRYKMCLYEKIYAS